MFWNTCLLRKWSEQALAEMNRVAGAVFIAYPSRQSLAAWIIATTISGYGKKTARLFLNNVRIESPGSIRLIKQRTKSVSDVPDTTAEKPQPIVEAARQLAAELFPHNSKKRKLFLASFRKKYSAARTSEILVIHSPGGWEMRIGIICRTGKRAL